MCVCVSEKNFSSVELPLPVIHVYMHKFLSRSTCYFSTTFMGDQVIPVAKEAGNGTVEGAEGGGVGAPPHLSPQLARQATLPLQVEGHWGEGGDRQGQHRATTYAGGRSPAEVSGCAL